MEVAVIAAMLAVGYFINDNQNNNTNLNKNPNNLRIKEKFYMSNGQNNQNVASQIIGEEVIGEEVIGEEVNGEEVVEEEIPTYRDIIKKSNLLKKAKNVMCAGEHRTENAPCPYPSSTDTLWQGNVEPGYVTLLSGEKIKSTNFRHANMTPHYGSKLTQNVDVGKPHSRLNLFTGSSKCVKPKKECKPFFKPQKNLGNIGAEHFRDIGVNNIIWANHNMRACITTIEETTKSIFESESINNVEPNIASVKDIFNYTKTPQLKIDEKNYSK